MLELVGVSRQSDGLVEVRGDALQGGRQPVQSVLLCQLLGALHQPTAHQLPDGLEQVLLVQAVHPIQSEHAPLRVNLAVGVQGLDGARFCQSRATSAGAIVAAAKNSV